MGICAIIPGCVYKTDENLIFMNDSLNLQHYITKGMTLL